MDEETINKQFYQKILILVRIKMNYHRDSEDICQEILIAILDTLRKDMINDPDKVTAYVKRICSNKITDRLRENYSNKEELTDFQADGLKVFNPDPNALDRLIREEERKKLDKALKSLSPRQRRILSLHYDDDWSFEKIAGFLNLEAASVRKIAARARKKLEKRFEINY